MLLTRITLANMRNYAALDFAPRPGLNVFVGANAQGKSNLLEAISLLGTGKSFRTSRESDLIRHDNGTATITGEARVRAGAVRLACTIAATAGGTRKLYALNGRSVRYAAFIGSVKVVTFSPADLQLVAGPPAGRRAMLNGALAQENAGYYRLLARYHRVLQQKNALLRGGERPDDDLLATYDQGLIEAGTEIVLARRHYVATLAAAVQRIYRSWARADDPLRVHYIPNVSVDVPTADGVAAAYGARLRELRPAEIARKRCLVGPHRDDVAFFLGEKAAGAYASQGQQRTVVLAVKVAEYGVLRERSGEAPILLLDDVFSELDVHRQAAFVEGIGGFEQAFLTSTAPLPALGSGATTYAVAAATLREVA